MEAEVNTGEVREDYSCRRGTEQHGGSGLVKRNEEQQRQRNKPLSQLIKLAVAWQLGC